MQTTNFTSIIRNRGQLTIPDGIRKRLKWIRSSSVISISAISSRELRITPHETAPVDWTAIWKGIHTARRYKGKRGNLSSFIAQDRETRR